MLELDKGYYCRNCDYIINKQKHQIDTKVRRQDHHFSTRLNYAKKKIRKNWMNMVNTTYNSTKNKIDKLQQLKGEIKLKFYKNISKYYDNMEIRIYEDVLLKTLKVIAKFIMKY